MRNGYSGRAPCEGPRVNTLEVGGSSNQAALSQLISNSALVDPRWPSLQAGHIVLEQVRYSTTRRSQTSGGKHSRRERR
jgi:hypothetical protein